MIMESVVSYPLRRDSMTESFTSEVSSDEDVSSQWSSDDEGKDLVRPRDRSCSVVDFLDTVQHIQISGSGSKSVWNEVNGIQGPSLTLAELSAFGAFSEIKVSKSNSKESKPASPASPRHTKREALVPGKEFLTQKSKSFSSAMSATVTKTFKGQVTKTNDTINPKISFHANFSIYRTFAYCQRKEKKKSDGTKVRRHHKTSKETRSSSFSSEDSAASGSLDEASVSEELNWLAYLHDSMSKEKVTHRTDANGRKVIRTASIDYLIKGLINLDPEEIPDKDDYIDTLVFTHPVWIPSLEFFDKLQELYFYAPTKSTNQTTTPRRSKTNMERKLTIFNVMKRWAMYGEVKEIPDLSAAFKDFADNLYKSPSKIEKHWAAQLREAIGVLSSESPRVVRKAPKLLRGGILSPIKKLGFKSFTIIDVDPMEIAKHMTAVDWRFFRKIKTSELLKKAWSREDKETQSPNLLGLIDSFNKTSNWVASEILSTGNPKMRIKVLERFIEVLKCLRSIQNFHGIFVIYSALSMQCIQSLRGLWDSISTKHIATMRETEQLIDPRSNFKTYRTTLKKAVPPLIPFEGLFLQDVTFIEENLDYVEELVNYEKMEMLGKVLQTIKKLQQHRYKHIHENSMLTDLIRKSPVISDDTLWKISKALRVQETTRRDSFNIGERSLAHKVL